jgi:ABC-type bacteriocin/lantibiotic exporter with double-glycine peptidase domain
MDLEIKKEILFSNVTFKYPTTAPELRPTLQAVNFRIKAG